MMIRSVIRHPDAIDPFITKMAKSFGFEGAIKLWNIEKPEYRLAFLHRPYSFDIVFIEPKLGYGCQVFFSKDADAVAELEALAVKGYNIFVSSSIHRPDKVIWPANWTREMVEIDLDMRGGC